METKHLPRLRVRNLGPIVNVDIVVNDFMLFIGPQASGKSTLAKIIYYFYSLPDAIYSFVAGPFLREDDSLPGKIDYDELNEYLLSRWVEMGIPIGTYVEYEWFPNVFLNFSGENISFSLSFADYIETLLKKLFRIHGNKNAKMNWFQQVLSNNYMWLRSKFILQYDGVMSCFIIPTDRSWTADLDPIRKGDLPFEQVEYLQLVKRLRRESRSTIKKDNPQLDSLYKISRKILCGKLLARQGGDILVFQKNNGEQQETGSEGTIHLWQASSGQQDAAWMVEIIIRLTEEAVKQTAMIIEEPEGHLFPEGQKAMMELLGLFFNTTKSRLVVTTHSPYMISALNNLIYAKDIHDANGDNETGNIIDPNLWIDGNKVGAYLLKDGLAQCIIDPDLGEINVDPIHSVMDDIDGEYRQLFRQEFGE